MIRLVVPYLIYSAVALICIFLQSELFSCIEIFNAKPDLLILLVVLSGLKSDWKNGIAAGLVLGFWLDLWTGGYFGMNMVVYGLIGGACGVLGTRFPDRTYEGYFFTIVAMTLFAGFLSLTVFNLLGADMPIGQSIAGIIFPMTFYTALISFLCLPLVWVYRRINGRKIGRIDLLGNGVIFVRGNEKVDMEAVIARRKQREQKRMREAQIKRENRQRRTEHSPQREANHRSKNRGADRNHDKRRTQNVSRPRGERRDSYADRRQTTGGRDRADRNRSQRHRNSGRRK